MIAESRPRGRMRQARHGPSRLPQVAGGEAISARGHRRPWILNKLRVDAARQIGPFSKVVITRAGLFRRGPPQGDAGRRLHGGLRGAGHHQRADGRRGGLRLPARLSRSPQGSSDKPQRVLVYDLGGGTFDVTVMEIRGKRVPRPGDRRRRAAGRLRLGPATGRPGGGAVQPRARLRSRARTPTRPASCGWSARTRSGPSPPAARPPWSATTAACASRIEITRAAVRGGHAGPAGSHAVYGGAGAEGGGTGLAAGGSRPAGGRLHPHAHGPRHAPAAFRQGARHLGRRRRGGGPRRGPAGRADPGRAPRAQPPSFTIRNVNSHSLGVVGIDPLDAPQAQRHPHSPQHAPAGHGQADLPHLEGQPALDPRGDRRGRKPFGRRLHADRPLLGPPVCRRICRPSRRSRSASTTRPTAAEGPRSVPKTDRQVENGDRPRERPQQGAHGRLAEVHLRG